MKWLILSLVLVYLGARVEALPKSFNFQAPVCGTPQECETVAKNYVDVIYEAEASLKCREMVNADFEYNIDLESAEKEQASTEASIAYSKFIFEAWNTTLRYFNYEEFADERLKRQMKFLNTVGTAALNDADLTKYNEILASMSRVYGTAKICPFEKQNCNLATEGWNLEPEIEELLSTSRNSTILTYVWKAWRDASGKEIREMYKEYIALSNKAAVENGLNNNGDLWLAQYEDPNFKAQVAAVWATVEELYKQLYGYARYKLREVYPEEFLTDTDPIPAHILGNMWAQSWEAIYPIVMPHPGQPGFDVTNKLQEKFPNTLEGVRALFAEANEFFTGLGLEDMSMSYGDNAMIIRPPDGRAVTCHASAWDFCDGEDYRIKMCTNINQEDYTTVHHELGHIQYFIMYKDQPITFRDGANPGFHEAIGDVLALSVATPKHMAKLGYLDSGELNPETTENFLMSKALEKIAFLPFGYLIDAYRWRLFDGSASLDEMELEWIKIRNEIQGIRPSVVRSEADFDPGAKYHVPGNTPYIRYFVSFILQFQIHKALCIAAGEYDPENINTEPLYNCDIAGSPEAGAIMKILLQKGFSDNWQDVLFEAIGEREMSGSAIKEYFAPLTNFFQRQQVEHGYSLDWKMDTYMEYYEDTQITDTTDPTFTSTGSTDPPTGSTDPPTGSTDPPTGSTDPPTTSDSQNSTEPERNDKLGTGLIITGIVQGVAIVGAAGAYVIKTFIMKS